MLVIFLGLFLGEGLSSGELKCSFKFSLSLIFVVIALMVDFYQSEGEN